MNKEHQAEVERRAKRYGGVERISHVSNIYEGTPSQAIHVQYKGNDGKFHTTELKGAQLAHQAKTGERIPARGRLFELTDGNQIFNTGRFNDAELARVQQHAELASGGNIYWRPAGLVSILQSAEDARRQALNGGAK